MLITRFFSVEVVAVAQPAEGHQGSGNSYSMSTQLMLQQVALAGFVLGVVGCVCMGT